MKVQGKVNGMTVEKNVNSLSGFVEYVKNTLEFKVSDIEKVQKVD